MGLLSDDAFVVDLHPFGERDLVVILLTKGQGLRRCAARGARGRMSRFGGALQPLNEVRATWFEREGKDLGSLREARAIREIFPAVERDPAAGAVSAWIADHLRSFAPEHEENDRFWRLAVHLRDALLAGLPPLLVARYAEVWTLRIAGIFPRLADCGRCGNPLDPAPGDGDVPRDAAGHFLCGSCARGGAVVPFSRDAGRALRVLLERPLPELVPLAEARDELAMVAGLCRDLRRAFLGRELVSREVVESMLGDAGRSGERE
jgi:DNA repair protein RecO (recombination protein O)